MTAIDEQKLMAFMGKVIDDWGAAASAPLVVLGDQLGLYRAMADGDPVTAVELAERTGTEPRYVREWLSAQAAGGYVAYDGDGRFHLEPEQALALTDESSPFCVLGGFESFTAATRIAPRLTEAYRTGAGVGWHEHADGLFRGTARFFRPGYAANLINSWIPALGGVAERLTAGGTVADVGCGYGYSSALMARGYPASRVVGFDPHDASIAAARSMAADEGLEDRLSFEVSTAGEFPGQGYDLITYFDCLHDMGDPIDALRHAAASLAEHGVIMLVEPLAGDDISDNLHPLGRVFYSISSLVCTPASLSQDGRAGLGAQAGPARLAEVAHKAGLGRVREATRTPFNLVLELRA